MPIAKHGAGGGRCCWVNAGGLAQRSSFGNLTLVPTNLGPLVQSIADSLHHMRRPAGTVACDRLAGNDLFLQGRREKFTTVTRFANGEAEVTRQATLCHVGESAGAKRCRNVLRLFVNRKDQNLRPRVFFAK